MKKIFFSGAAIFMLALGSLTTTVSLSSCTKDDDSSSVDNPTVSETVKLSNVTAIAQTDGTVTIQGTITTNTKVKLFGLSSSNEGKDTDIADMLDATTKSKGDDGKEWNTTITSTTLPVSKFPCYLVLKTRGDKVIYEKIGEEFDLILGTGSNKTIGSQASLYNNAAYLLGDFYANKAITNADIAQKLDVVLKGEGTSASLQPISTASFYANLSKDEQATLPKAFVSGNTIISSQNLIANYTAAAGSAENTVEFKGVILGVTKAHPNTTLKVDVSKVTSSLTK